MSLPCRLHHIRSSQQPLTKKINVDLAQPVERKVMGWMARVQFLAGARDFSLLHRIQTYSGAHPASYSMCIRGKAARTRRWPLMSMKCQGQECRSYSSTPPYIFMAECLINHTGKFTLFYLTPFYIDLLWRYTTSTPDNTSLLTCEEHATVFSTIMELYVTDSLHKDKL
jgi:hypothetical protein